MAKQVVNMTKKEGLELLKKGSSVFMLLKMKSPVFAGICLSFVLNGNFFFYYNFTYFSFFTILRNALS